MPFLLRPGHFVLALCLVCCFVRAFAAGTVSASDVAPLRYVGSQACLACHAAQGSAWQESHHARAMQPANAQTVLGDFNNARFTNAGVTSRFFQRGGKYFVNTDGHQGKPADYEIRHTFGVYPLQQYLIEIPGGRLQALSIAWDARRRKEGGQRWYSLYPDQNIKAGDPLHWSGRDQNWNFMCAACHSTGVQKNYDLARNTYATTRIEDGVGCETCHGPGSRHLDWTRRHPGGDDGARNKGLVRAAAAKLEWQFTTGQPIASPQGDVATARTGMESCFACHARRQDIVSEKDPEAPFLDTYLPSLLDRNLYHADGQIDGEVFEFGSFAQSRMYRAGVTCANCHDVHTQQLKAEGNALCLQCHSATTYQKVAHFHHPLGSAGAQCVNCHMPHKTYMGVDERRDHSLRIPRPDLTLKFRTPNACNQCHADKSAQWAADAIAAWTGKPPGSSAHPAGSPPPAGGGPGVSSEPGAAIDAAWFNSPAADRLLSALARRKEAAGITRATALSQLVGPASAQTVATIEAAARDPDPLVRIGAARGLQAVEAQDALRIGLPLLGDAVRAVRIEAARALAGAPDMALAVTQRQQLKAAIAELIRSEQAAAERPESHVNLAQLYLRLGRTGDAERALNTALRLDRRFVPAMVNLADLERSLGREDEAARWLTRAMAAGPQAAEPVHALGLLEIRRGRRDRALPLLRKAAALAPADTRYAYVYALALQESGTLPQALDVVEKALNQSPQDASLLQLRIALEKRMGRNDDARRHETEYRRIAAGS